MALNIVLMEPEIPQNTGNIARTCAALGAALHLIGPLGFSLESKFVRRAGLDYWDMLALHRYDSFEKFQAAHPAAALYPCTTKAERLYTDISYARESYLLFGKESKGLPEELIITYRDSAVRIPMTRDARSLNLSNAAAVAAYEYFRQHEFCGLERRGELHRHSWKELPPEKKD